MGKERAGKRQSVLFYITKNIGEIYMKRLMWIVLILVVISAISGCARTKRIANDVDWIVFDGKPSREN